MACIRDRVPCPWVAPSIEPTGDDQSGAALFYFIDNEVGILRQQWRGAVDRHDVIKFWKLLISDGRTLSVGRHLDDLRDCRLMFSGEGWFHLIRDILQKMPTHASWKAAIIVNSSETLGVVRQFLGYAGDLVEAEIFFDMAEGEAWLCASESSDS